MLDSECSLNLYNGIMIICSRFTVFEESVSEIWAYYKVGSSLFIAAEEFLRIREELY